MKLIFTSIIAMLLSIAAFSQSVTVTQPNGGETLYGCQTYQIKWNSSGVSNFWNLDYSLDGGTIWSSIATGLFITNGQYNWTVPSVNSGTVYVRVRDNQDTLKTDRSDGFFTVQRPIAVTSPNGGETWQGLTVHNITWSAAGTSGFFNLAYSIDNGSNWISITNNYAGNTYSWTVPNNPSALAMVRVTDATTTCQADQSDAAFTISPATPQLITPNGGEVWTVNTSQNITWNTTTFYSTLQLEYSSNGGSTWNLITASTPNNGSYTWTVPNSPGTQSRVRASNSANTAVNDISNANFTITMPTPLVTYPNGGEIIMAYDQTSVTWNPASFVSNVKIEYSLNNGFTWLTMVSSTANNGSYTWTTPNTPSNAALVRISNVAFPTVMDTSDAIFILHPPVRVTRPNLLTDSATICSNYTINYQRPANVSTNTVNYYELYYSVDAGATYTYITVVSYSAGNANASYVWAVPSLTPTNLGRIKMIAYNSSGVAIGNDSSDVNFKIGGLTGFINVTQPNGGVTLTPGSTYNVQWTASGSSGTYSVQYSTTGANGSYTAAANNIVGNNYNLTVPNIPSTNVFIKVVDQNQVCRYDTSNAANTISPYAAQVTSPNGGEVWDIGNIYNITWNNATYYGTVNIEYSTDGGTTWNTVVTGVSNNGSYAWTVPNAISTNALIKVYQASNIAQSDVSNAVFTLRLPKPLITSPNGGEQLMAYDQHTITWNTTSISGGGSVNLSYSINGGSTWTNITTVSNSGSYTWTIPNAPSNAALIRLTNVAFNSQIDTSDAVFTIMPPIKVTRPNLLTDSATICSNYTINYQRPANVSTNTVNYYELYYSVDAGATYTYITVVSYSAGNANASYVWAVPSLTPTNLGRIKMIAYNSSGVAIGNDSSDVNFKIGGLTGFINVTQPNGGVTLTPGSTYNVQWTASGSSGTYSVQYSTTGANGSYTAAANNIVGNNYNLTVPNIPSTNVFIKVVDQNQVCRYDTSNTANTISPYAAQVTSPNGGEVWDIGNIYNITWNNATYYGAVNIEYSTDGGATWNTVVTGVSNNGSYAWTVPNAISTNALIKVYQASNIAQSDVSNAVFTLRLPKPLITSPNGGEQLMAYDQHTITWNTTSISGGGSVNLSYSINGGSTWTNITTVSNSGSYTWTIPNAPSNAALVRLTNVAFNSQIDTSDAVFTIMPPIKVTRPNLSTDSATICSNYTINYQRPANVSTNTVNYYELYYSVDAGATYTYITVVSYSAGNANASYVWAVPSLTPTNLGRIKMIAYNSSGVAIGNDSSDVNFKIGGLTGFINVTQPNGGVTLTPGSTYNVQWTASGSSGTYSVQYSTTGANGSYTAAANNIVGNNYNLTVPNVPSANVFIKVVDQNQVCRYDTSNAANTISPYAAQVTSPNGGEVWDIGNIYNITWNNATYYGAVNIEYSTDGGATWNTVVTGVSNNGTYAWTVPNAISTNALIKVYQASNIAQSDVSNAVFTLRLPKPLITSPNGGEQLMAYDQHTITWNTTSISGGGSVNLSYSINGGSTWTNITTVSNSGSYTWTIPNAPSNAALIRLTNVAFNSQIDTSDAVFTIMPPIKVTRPNLLTDSATICSNYTINYQRPANVSTNTVNYYELYYSVDAGATYTYITVVSYSAGNANASYVWAVPSLTPTNLGRIKMIAYNSSGVAIGNDSSDVNFKIGGLTGFINVTQPNGGVTLTPGSTYNVQWTASGSSGTYSVQYSTTGANGSYTAAANNIVGNNYNLTVPNVPSANVFIKVVDQNQVCRYDTSNAANTISPYAAQVTSPNGGEVWDIGNIYNITWNNATYYGAVNIEYSTDGGATWNTVVTGVSNNGTYAWTVPNAISTNALIKVYQASNIAQSDVSNAVFTLRLPKPLITSPNGGEQLMAYDQHTITWNTTSISGGGSVNLSYSINGGSTWTNITTVSNSGSYTWTIPNAPSNAALIRLTNVAFNSQIDTSDAVFTIMPPIKVTRPNLLTDSATICSNYTINYQRPANVSTNTVNYYELYYSVDAGATYTYITVVSYSAGNANASYVWAVPSLTPTNLGRIKMIAYNSSGVAIGNDSSDVNFKIGGLTGFINVTQPNGGVTLTPGSTYNVQWTASGSSGTYSVQYSTTGANGSYTAAANNIVGNNYNLTVPNVPSTNVFIKVVDQNQVCRYDTSNAANTISPYAAQVTSPNGGESWNILSTQNITWNSATFYGVVNIEYSTDGGTTWNTVATNVSNNGSYSWSVPNSPSATALIKVYQASNPAQSDVSNAVFTINIPQPQLTSPNGGETWFAGTTQTVTWNINSLYANARLEYTLDSGATWVSIANNLSNTGTYNWLIPNVNSVRALVRLSNVGNPTLTDVSNAIFTLRPYVRIITPAANDILGACTQTTISFERSPVYTTYAIEYSTNNGQSWITLVGSQTFSQTFNTYSWTVPNSPSNQSLVRIYPTTATNNGDTSDVYTIRRAVTIIQPNFGGTLVIGSSYQVQWQSDGISNLYDLAYSTTGASGPWINIITGFSTSQNLYNWTVPNAPSTNCYLRIRDNVNSCKEDISDLPFTIANTPNAITVATPNGNDTLRGCQNYNITWTESGSPIGNYNLSYSTNSGSTWITIAANYLTTSGSYAWVVPNLNSATALVRVQSGLNPLILDISNALFTILPGSVVATPDTTICQGNQVILHATGGTGTYVWTPSGTLSNANIANPVATPVATTVYTATSTNGSCVLSDTAKVTVVPASASSPGVTIVASPSNTICAGASVTFTATPVNGGSNPSYQWKINGVGVGGNSPIYVSTSLANADQVTVEITSNAACLSTSTATSNTIAMSVSPVVAPSITISATTTTICGPTSITFTAVSANGGNSPVYQWKVNGVISGTNSPTFTTSALVNTDVVTATLVSNANCVSPSTVTSNALTITGSSLVAPTIVISTGTTTICAGTPVVFTANITNGGTAPAYQWYVNGNPAGTNSSTFTTSTLANNNVVTAQLTSNSPCATTTTASSNGITMTVNSVVTPSVSIAATGSTSVCSGQNISFTATPTNGGSSPAYQWKRNGTAVGTGTVYSSSALSSNDIITVEMTSNATCPGSTVVTSNAITVTVFPSVTPTIAISSGSSAICSGASITFTAAITNGGTSPVYQWKKNGLPVGTNSATYVATGLNNNDLITADLTSNANCATSTTITSNSILVTITPAVTPTITISTPSTTICAGQQVVFTAAITNGGSAPVYQWKKNGGNVGTGLSTYTTTTLNNGDQITAELTSNVACATTTTVTSNILTITTSGTVVPSVSIASNDLTTCAGQTATFTATPVNGGSTPSYQWKVNNINSGAPTTSATFTSSTLTTGNTVSVVMTSNSGCASPTSGTSNVLTVTVNPSTAPGVTVSSTATSICAGTQVTFTATATNAGTPTYQWQLNGTTVGTNSSTFVSSSLNHNDSIWVIVTSSSACSVPSNAVSTKVKMTVNPPVTPSVSISATTSSICSGTSVIFNASPTNGGTTPAYQWTVNSVNAGTNSSSFSSSILSNNDTVRVVLTTNAACPTQPTAISNGVIMSVTPATVPTVSISASGNNICTGTAVTFTATATNTGNAPVYAWKLNGFATGSNSPTYSSSALANGDVVSVILTSNAACASPLIANSNNITMVVTPATTPTAQISTPLTSVCSGASVTFTANTSNGGSSPVYQWKVNGNNAGINSNTFTTAPLTANTTVTLELTSNAACASPLIVTSNAVTITVNSAVTPSVSIGATSTAICAGTSVTFTATPANGGGTPAYQWLLNGSNIATGASYTSTTLADNDVVRVVMTSSAACASPAAVTSNTVTMTVTPSVVPSVTVSASATNICTGNSVTFTATPVNGGPGAAFQWKVNGLNVTGSGTTYTSSSLSNNDIVSVVMTGNAPCGTLQSVSSNGVAIIVNTASSPSVGINASSTIICSGVNVTFNANVTNGGVNPTYAWKVNGFTVATTTSFSSTTLINGDLVSLELTAQNPCAGALTVTSNTIPMQVAPSVTPGVTVVATNTNICAGTSVTFTATPTNGGSGPVYQWMVNSIPVGSNSNTFTSATLQNNDTVKVVLSSSATCAVPANVGSTPIVMSVGSPVAPTVTVSSTTTTFCAGTSATFTAAPGNGGATPAYQWKVNGNNVTGSGDTYTTSALADGDLVSVQMTTSASCATSSSATSTPIAVTVSAQVSATISVSASATSICAGGSVSFTATSTHGGTLPVYQWKVNGLNVTGSGSAYTTATLSNGDVVTSELTSNEACVVNPVITSTGIAITVGQPVTPAVTVSASASSICPGTSVTFTATPANGGPAPAYVWKVNGVAVSTTGSTYTSITLQDGDTVTATLTSNASCASPLTAVSNKVGISVATVTQPTVSISASSNNICSGTLVTISATVANAGGSPAYQWQLNGTNVATSTTYASSSFADGDLITLEVTASGACNGSTSATSAPVAMVVNQTVTPTVQISASNTTTCPSGSITFTATPTNGGTPTYDWKVNGISAGTNSPTFTSTGWANNDMVTVEMLSSLSCATVPLVVSNSITMAVNASITPTALVTANPAGAICQGTSVSFTAATTNGGTAPTYNWKLNGITVATTAGYSIDTLDNNDVVSLTYTSNDACAAPAFVTTQTTMAVNPVPVVPAVTTNSPVCEGTSLNLSTPNVAGATYSWSGPNGFGATTQTTTIDDATLQADGDYQVVVELNGCQSAPATVSVTVNAAPAKPVVTQVDLVLTSSIATDVQWTLNGNNIANATAASYTVGAGGWYVVKASNSDGCTTSSDSLLVVYTGIEEVAQVINMTAYPNPVTDRLTVKIDAPMAQMNNWTLEVTDVTGKVIFKREHTEELNVFDFRHYAGGLYFIRLNTGKDVRVQKVVVTK